MTDYNVGGTGAVLPVAAPISLNVSSFDVDIIAADPENGYEDNGAARPSDHMMVRALYPEGLEKTHQVKDVNDLAAKINAFIQRRYNVASFEFVSIPQDLTVGGRFAIINVAYEE